MNATETDTDRELTDEEIHAILERENAGLPAEAHVPAKPVKLVESEPGQGRYARWMVWFVIAFIVLGMVQSMR